MIICENDNAIIMSLYSDVWTTLLCIIKFSTNFWNTWWFLASIYGLKIKRKKQFIIPNINGCVLKKTTK